MDAAIIQSGKFISNGQAKTLSIRSDFDWIQTYNLTAINQAAANLSAMGYWQIGMAPGQGVNTIKLGNVVNDPLSIDIFDAGFTPVDSSGNPLGSQVATTNVSNATSPVVLTGDTTGVNVGSVVRLYKNDDTVQYNGLDIVVGAVTADTSFTAASVFSNGAANGGAQDGFYRLVNFDPLFYPSNRTIVNIEENDNNSLLTDITLSVPSGYYVGQTVRLSIPPEFDAVELDGKIATITNVNDTLAIVNDYPAVSITVDIPMANVTPFVYPDEDLYPFTPALVVPVGENTAYAISQSQNILSDATYNTGYIGVILAAGANSPAGQNGDFITWVAGKSSYTQNT